MDSSDDENGNSCYFNRFEKYVYMGVSTMQHVLVGMPFCVFLRRWMRIRI